MKNQANKSGVYTLRPELVHGYPTWKQRSYLIQNSIWFDASNGRWKIGFTSALGSNIAAIMGPYAEDDWPLNLSGWEYTDRPNHWTDAGSDVVIEDYSEGKYENNINSKSLEIHSIILISF